MTAARARAAAPAELADKKPAPAKKAAKAAAKAPAPARPRQRPAVHAETEPVDGAPPEPVTITFHNRVIPVMLPNAEQMALILEMQAWSKKLKAWKAEIPDDAPDDHPARKLAEQALRRMSRLVTIVGTLMPEEAWEDIQDDMAAKLIPWQEIANLPAQVIQAHNEQGETSPDNRAARRAAGQRGRRV